MMFHVKVDSSRGQNCKTDDNNNNKCSGDDTKAAARESPNCIKKTKNVAKNDFHYGGWNSYTLQYGTVMTLISPGDCTMQCGM